MISRHTGQHRYLLGGVVLLLRDQRPVQGRSNDIFGGEPKMIHSRQTTEDHISEGVTKMSHTTQRIPSIDRRARHEPDQLTRSHQHRIGTRMSGSQEHERNHRAIGAVTVGNKEKGALKAEVRKAKVLTTAALRANSGPVE